MSRWQEHNYEEKILAILSDVHYYVRKHHFGRPFITAYQLAIEFARRHPAEVEQLKHSVGGEGIGQRYSLSQYLARELSRKIKSREITNIEGSFLSNSHLTEIVFNNNGQPIKSSLTDTPFDVSMFRLRE